MFAELNRLWAEGLIATMHRALIEATRAGDAAGGRRLVD